MAAKKVRHISGLYYITHIENLPSIMEHESNGINFTPIYDSGIVSSRKEKTVPDGRSLWQFANLYFQARNAMLYRVVCEKSSRHIAIISIRPDIVNRNDIFISTGNAASYQTEIVLAGDGRKKIPKILEDADREYWSSEDGSKRRMMAECLIPTRVPPEDIQTVYVANHEAAGDVRKSLRKYNVPVVPQPEMFFQPSLKIDLTRTLSLVSGDMFFSRFQTVTVSVNCVGIMGKGLASRAKYQFPDVYVFYQDLCNKNKLRMGKPFLYKREQSFDEELAENPVSLPGASDTWFLLFPTKHHWREVSDVKGIEAGIEWLASASKEEGITSLAIPALGCGLGRLAWKEVGPILVKHLSRLKIPVWIYLPAEREECPELLTKEFLLPK
jgi:hypothetical protein